MAIQLKQSPISIQWFQVALLAVLISFSIAAWHLIKLYQAHVYHQHLENNTLNQTTLIKSHLTSQALFANAIRYGYQGQSEKALSAYATVASQTDDVVLRQSAYYNSGNLYLMLGTAWLEREGLPGWDVAGPLIALAKESYQKALRLNPQWSEAKYNYQLALRLAPTSHGMRGPQQYEDENIKQEDKPSGWPAMPGNPRGMP